MRLIKSNQIILSFFFIFSRYFVARKDIELNVIYCVNSKSHPALWSKTIRVNGNDFNLLVPDTFSLFEKSNIHCSIRSYDKIGTLITSIDKIKAETETAARKERNKGKISDEWIIELSEPVYAPTPGQQAVLYLDNLCLGGAIINRQTSLLTDNQLL